MPRLQTVHWNNCRVAHLRPDAEVEDRPGPGRPPRTYDRQLRKNNMAAQPTPILPPNSNINKPQRSADEVTQPRTQAGAADLVKAAESAAAAENYYSPSPSPDPWNSQHTGPPPVPFTNQNKSPPTNVGNSWQLPDQALRDPALPDQTLRDPAESGQRLASHQNEARVVPPATGPNHLLDHDYTSSRPQPLSDHNYYRSLPSPTYQPNIGPPPGFSQGRPKRVSKQPSRFQDYDMS